MTKQKIFALVFCIITVVIGILRMFFSGDTIFDATPLGIAIRIIWWVWLAAIVIISAVCLMISYIRSR